MKFKYYSQDELDLFPIEIYAEIPKNDICRFINEIVNELNLEELESIYSEEGNIAYHPRMMLKVIFYSYYNGVFSSRRIAKELERNIFFWYLSARQRPDFRTISNFRKRHIKQLKGLFRQIVNICISMGIANVRKVAIDGTKIKASANRDKFRDKEWFDKILKEEEDAIDRAFNKMEEIDEEEDKLYGYDKRGDELPENLQDPKERIRKIRELQKKMEEGMKKSINETDPECELMKTRHGYEPAYNCQTVVDTESQIILTEDVIACPEESGQIQANIDILMKETGLKPGIVLADAGYLNGGDLQYLNGEGITGLIADKEMRKIKKEREGVIDEDQKYKKDQFKYDVERDEYICPDGKKLIRIFKKNQKVKRKNGLEVEYMQYQCLECGDCINIEKCCRSKKNRNITRYEDEELRVKMHDLLRSDWGYETYKARMCTNEPVFGNIKYNKRFSEFHLRGLTNVKGEFTMMAIVHNLEKMWKKMGNNPLKTECRSSLIQYQLLNYLFLFYYRYFKLNLIRL